VRHKKLFFWALTSSLAGFLFGFDTVVISGAEQTVQSLWDLSAAVYGLAISMALWGTGHGARLAGRRLADRKTGSPQNAAFHWGSPTASSP